MSENVGRKIKQLRNAKKLTLKDLSVKTGLSTGFLSQLERGLTTVATTSLEDIAKALDVDLSYFFVFSRNRKDHVIRSYEQTVSRIEANQFIHFHLSNDLENKDMLPRMVTLLPNNMNEEKVKEFPHEGEEFVYVLEGVLTLIINKEKYELYPGDSIHFDSSLIHNWCNNTNKITKIIVVNTPNPFRVNKK